MMARRAAIASVIIGSTPRVQLWWVAVHYLLPLSHFASVARTPTPLCTFCNPVVLQSRERYFPASASGRRVGSRAAASDVVMVATKVTAARNWLPNWDLLSCVPTSNYIRNRKRKLPGIWRHGWRASTMTIVPSLQQPPMPNEQPMSSYCPHLRSLEAVRHAEMRCNLVNQREQLVSVVALTCQRLCFPECGHLLLLSSLFSPRLN